MSVSASPLLELALKLALLDRVSTGNADRRTGELAKLQKEFSSVYSYLVKIVYQ